MTNQYNYIININIDNNLPINLDIDLENGGMMDNSNYPKAYSPNKNVGKIPNTYLDKYPETERYEIPINPIISESWDMEGVIPGEGIYKCKYCNYQFRHFLNENVVEIKHRSVRDKNMIEVYIYHPPEKNREYYRSLNELNKIKVKHWEKNHNIFLVNPYNGWYNSLDETRRRLWDSIINYNLDDFIWKEVRGKCSLDMEKIRNKDGKYLEYIFSRCQLGKNILSCLYCGYTHNYVLEYVPESYFYKVFMEDLEKIVKTHRKVCPKK